MPVPAGLIAVSWVGDSTCTPVAATPPKVTVAGLAKLVPVMVTVVPPAAGPDDGDTFVTVGDDVVTDVHGCAAAAAAGAPPSKPTAAAPAARAIAIPRARNLPAIAVSPHRRSAA